MPGSAPNKRTSGRSARCVTTPRWAGGSQTSKGRLAIDRAKVKAEGRLDRKYLLATSDPDLTAEDATLAYKNLCSRRVD